MTTTAKANGMPQTVIEAERAVLGSMLIDNAAAAKAVDMLTHTDFYQQSHRDIFQAAVAVFKKDRALDRVTLSEEIRSRWSIGAIGGDAYLRELIHSVSTADHVEHYATLVKEASLDRQVATQLHKTADNKTAENLAKLSALMDALHGVRTDRLFDFRKDLPGMLDDLLTARADLIDTGFLDLDKILGGLDPGDLTTVGARTSGGKTAMMVKLAVQLAGKHGRECLYITTEMTREQIVTRVLPMASEVPAWKFRRRRFDQDDYKKINKACEDMLSKLRLQVACKTVISLGDIRNAVLKAKPRVVFVDYLQRCAFGSGDTRAYQVMDFMKDLKTMAQELRLNIFIGCQLNRALDTDPDREPENSDLKDSGGIEAESDQVVLLWKPTDKRLTKEGIDVPPGQHLVRAKVSKNRHGVAFKTADFLLNGQLVDLVERVKVDHEIKELWSDRL